jgi:transposase
MSVYSTDVRRLVMARVERGEAVGEVAERFGISTKTIGRWLERQRQGRLEPDRCGPKGPVKLTPVDDQVLREALRQQPGLTLN